MGEIIKKYNPNKLSPRQERVGRIYGALEFYFNHNRREHLPIPVRKGIGIYDDRIFILDGHNRACVLGTFGEVIDLFVSEGREDIMNPRDFPNADEKLIKESNQIIENNWGNAEILISRKYVPSTIEEMRMGYWMLRDEKSAKRWYESKKRHMSATS